MSVLVTTKEVGGAIVASDELNNVIAFKESVVLLSGINRPLGGNVTAGPIELKGNVLSVGGQCVLLECDDYAVYRHVNLSSVLAANTHGHVVAIEGTDGVGKTSFMQLLYGDMFKMLFAGDYDRCVKDRFPCNENTVGAQIRRKLTGRPEDIVLEEMGALYALDRVEYWRKHSKERNTLYIFDRYVISNLTMINRADFKIPPLNWIKHFTMLDSSSHGIMPSLNIVLLGDRDIILGQLATKEQDALEGKINLQWNEYIRTAAEVSSSHNIFIHMSDKNGWKTKGQILKQLLDGASYLVSTAKK